MYEKGKKVYNVLIAGDYGTNDEVSSYIDNIHSLYRKTNKFEIGEFRIVTSAEEVGEVLNREEFDILICFDRIKAVSIGGGTMARWRENNKNLRIMLIMSKAARDGDEEKGIAKSTKPKILYDKGFYDCFFAGTFKSPELLSVTVNGRSKEDAREYYHLPEDETAAPSVSIPSLFADDEEEVEEVAKVVEEVTEEAPRAIAADELTLGEQESSFFVGNTKLDAEEFEYLKSQALSAVRGNFVEAELVYICSADTAVVRLKDGAVNLFDEQFDGVKVLIPCVQTER